MTYIKVMDLELINHSSTSHNFNSSEDIKMSQPNRWRLTKKWQILKIVFITIAAIAIIFNFGVGIFNFTQINSDMKDNSDYDGTSDEQSGDNKINTMGKFQALQSNDKLTPLNRHNQNSQKSLSTNSNNGILSTEEREIEMYDILTNLSNSFDRYAETVKTDNHNIMSGLNASFGKQMINVSSNQLKIYNEIRALHNRLVNLSDEIPAALSRKTSQLDSQLKQINFQYTCTDY